MDSSGLGATGANGGNGSAGGSGNSSRLRRGFRALDAFPKVEDEYQTRSVSGAVGIAPASMRGAGRGLAWLTHVPAGCVSIVRPPVTSVVAVLLLALVVSEFASYRAVTVKYEYLVDKTAPIPLVVNVDIDIAMKCDCMGGAHGRRTLAAHTLLVRSRPHFGPTVTKRATFWLRSVDAALLRHVERAARHARVPAPRAGA